MRQTLESIRTKLFIFSAFLIQADRFLVAKRCGKQPTVIPDDLLQQYANHLIVFAQIEAQLMAIDLAKSGTNPRTDKSFSKLLREMEIKPHEIYLPTPGEIKSANEAHLNKMLTSIMGLRNTTFQMIDPDNHECNCAPLNDEMEISLYI